MNFLDFILVGILCVALIRGLMRGMIRQVASLLGILAGFVAAGHFHLRLLHLLRSHLPSIPHLEVLSYVIIFTASWLLAVLLGMVAVRLSKAMLMGWADRLLGGMLGLLKGAVASVVLIAVLTLFLPGRSTVLARSALAAHAQTAGHFLVQLTPDGLRSRYEQKRKMLKHQLKRQKKTPIIKKIKK